MGTAEIPVHGKSGCNEIVGVMKYWVYWNIGCIEILGVLKYWVYWNIALSVKKKN